jgi:hypothetical protein
MPTKLLSPAGPNLSLRTSDASIDCKQPQIALKTRMPRCSDVNQTIPGILIIQTLAGHELPGGRVRLAVGINHEAICARLVALPSSVVLRRRYSAKRKAIDDTGRSHAVQTVGLDKLRGICILCSRGKSMAEGAGHSRAQERRAAWRDALRQRVVLVPAAPRS